MVHHGKSPGRRSGDWSGDWKDAVVGGAVLAMAILTVVKGGWPAVAPFALASLVVAGLFVYLRWLTHLRP